MILLERIIKKYKIFIEMNLLSISKNNINIFIVTSKKMQNHMNHVIVTQYIAELQDTDGFTH